MTLATVALAKQGAKVTVAIRRSKEGEETVRLIKEAGSDGIFVKTDVANENDVTSLVEKTVKQYNRLVNLARINQNYIVFYVQGQSK